ncbi:MAG: Rpn family recombination-promoting nuclease/putative transposase [Planctomycetaceae bacterium]|jgi:predicted transposase/invertase (TIGR01784 family)|nr:Rpn family recombination-promoting nuclease/putative transposase [Planctomycetaceae bacterium]
MENTIEPDKAKPAENAFDKIEDFVIKPTSDLFISVFLSNPNNENILINFINAFLIDAGSNPIVSAKVGSPFSLREYSVEKQIVLDVKVRDELGRYYNIEVQTYQQNEFNDRLIFGWSKTYSGQAIRGMDYSDLCCVIAIAIVEFLIFPLSEKLHFVFNVREKDEHDIVLSDKLQIHLLCLYLVLKGDIDKLRNISPDLAYWTIFFIFGKESEETMQKLSQKYPIIKEAFEQPVIRQAQEQFRRYIADPEVRDIERRHQEYLFLQQVAFNRRYKEGIEEGIEKGIVKGKIENKIEVAHKMKAKGFSVKDIADITDLSYEEIGKL